VVEADGEGAPQADEHLEARHRAAQLVAADHPGADVERLAERGLREALPPSRRRQPPAEGEAQATALFATLDVVVP